MFTDIKTHFKGKVPGFLQALADADPALLRVTWAFYKKTLFESSSLVNQRLKYMMLFETVRAHSKCQKCIDVHAATMRDIGINDELLKELNQDISSSKILDEETKNLLIFALYIASFDSRTKDQLDTKMLEGFTALVGQKKITEVIMLVATSKTMQDFIHLSHLGH